MSGKAFFLWWCMCGGLLMVVAQDNTDSLRNVWQDPSQTEESRTQALYGLVAFFDQVQPDSVQRYAQLLYDLGEANGKQEEMAHALMYLGSAKVIQGKMDEAAAYFSQNLAIRQEMGDEVGMAGAWNNLGIIAFNKGNYDLAIDYFTKSFQVIEKTGNQETISKGLNNLGVLHQQLGQYDQALYYLRRSHALAKTIGDKEQLSSTTINMGVVYRQLGKYDSALWMYEQSRAMAEADNNQVALARVLSNIATIYVVKGEFEQALAYNEQSLRIEQETGNQNGISRTLHNLGEISQEQGDFQQAIDYYGQSLAIKQAIGDLEGMANSLDNIGVMYAKQADYPAAIDYFSQSLAICDSIGDPSGIARAWSRLGGVYLDQGDNPQALKLLEQSLAEYQRLGEQTGTALVLSQLGKLYQQTGDLSQALTYQQQSLTIQETVDNKYGIANALVQMGDIYTQLGNANQAIAASERGLQLGQLLRNPALVQSAAGNLHLAYKQQGRYQDALSMHELEIQMRDSLNSLTNQRATIRYAYQQVALEDSLAFVQQRAADELAYQNTLNRRNLWLAGAIILLLIGLSGFLLFRSQQQKRNREQALALAQERERKEQLAQLDALKSRFFANLSHEFRTPLTIIQGMVRQIQSKPRQWQEQGLDMIERNSRRLLHLVNQMLDLAKLESGHLSLNLVQGDIKPFLSYLVDSFQSYAEMQELHIHYLPGGQSLIMDHDPDRLTDVISNLLANAIKFTPAAGNIYLSWQQVAEDLVVKVRDTGIGIPAEKVPYIFDRFFQADDSTTRSSEGTGLGLALSYELVQLMKGDLSVQSTEGEGSEFTLRLPIAQSAPQVAASSVPAHVLTLPIEEETLVIAQATASARPQVLIIEDSLDVVRYLVSCLADEYQIEVARDGQAGIDKALELVPDLIISDVMMPKKDGFEVVQTLKQDIRTSHIPIVMLTARVDRDAKLTGLSAGADAYLPKPFDEEELRIRLENLQNLRKTLLQKYQDQTVPADSVPPSPTETDPQALTLSLDEQFLHKLREIMAAHLDDYELDVAKLCELVGMGRTQLHRKLKALTGKSTTQYVREYRLAQAQQLLRETDEPVSTIAYQTGFSNPNWFTRAFAERYGQSPTAFREAG